MHKKYWLGSLSLFFFLLFISLSIWQAYRAQAKSAQLAAFNDHTRPPLSQVPKHIDPKLQFQSIRLIGTYDNNTSFLLDNRFYQHHAGYNVITPFNIPGHTSILVNRGFIDHNGDRSQLPHITPVKGKITVSGRLYHPKHAILLSKTEEQPSEWPILVQSIDFDAMSQKLGYPIAPYVLMLDHDAPSAYPSEWQPTIMTPARHIGYAVQWLLLAITVLIGTLLFYRKSNRSE